MAKYDSFAEQYDKSMGESGDYFHRTQIDPYLLQIIGHPKGKTIYDLGCGNGYLARQLARGGAAVFASDASSKLIKIATNKSSDLNINYSIHEALDFSSYPDAQFDIVFMNMVIQYIQDLPTLFRGISRILKVGGIFAFSLNHVFRPPYPYSEWVKGKINNIETLFIKTTDYLGNREKLVTSGWDNQTELTLYNHTLGDLVNTLSANNLYLAELYEPISEGFTQYFPAELLAKAQIPTFLILGAKKINLQGQTS